MSLVDRANALIAERRRRLLEGKVNCIPSPLTAFKYDFPGIEKGTYYLISAASKASKSKFTNFIFLFNAVLYAYNHPDLVRLKIFYALLEETDITITLKFELYLLYTMSKMRLDIKTMKSVDLERILPERALELLNTLEYQSILRFYEDHVVFIPDRNPTGIYNALEKYANTHGTTYKKKIDGYEHEVFDYYVPNDPEEYVMCIVDNINIISSERQMSLKGAIDKLSEYMKIVRNKYQYIPVMVQQQNSETISLEAFKAGKIRPTQKGCKDSQQPAQDCDIMLGITNPFSFELENYLKYDITKLKSSARFLEVVLGRDGESNAVLGMYFDGATGFYAALPKANDITELNKVYQLIQRNHDNTL